MARTKAVIQVDQYEVRDNRKERNLIMFVPRTLGEGFMRSSFFHQVEAACKIVDKDTGKVLKDRAPISEAKVESIESVIPAA